MGTAAGHPKPRRRPGPAVPSGRRPAGRGRPRPTRDRGRTWSAPGLAPGIAGNYPALAVAASGTLLALDADQRTMVSSDDQGRTWTHRSTDLPGRGYTAIHGMTFADAASGWLLTASLTGCGPACDPEGAVLATRSAGRSWTPVVPGR
jgi:photosystem II stability/assembly factor-like uncharacterized protein